MLSRPVKLGIGDNGEGTNGYSDYQVPLTAAEYFAGIGLVRLGLNRAGWQVHFANDFDPGKYEMYSSYYVDAEEHYQVADVFDIDPESVPQTTLATSSFPCIDLSLAGNLDGLAGKHSSAFWGFIRILEAQGEKRPPLVMLENVPGWLISNGGEDFRVTIEALNRLGYWCDVIALNAQRFTPQSRIRVFVVGSILPGLPEGRKLERLRRRPSSLATKRLVHAVESHADLNWRFLDLPSPPALNSEGLSNIIEYMSDDDPRWWDESDVQKHLEMMTPSHRERVKKLTSSDVVGYRTIYRRRRQGKQRAEVRKGDTAGCLRTARGGSSRQIVVAAGNGRVRMRFMTPREYARLQGVPDNYPLPKNVNQALTGFGDAVCVPVITWIAENMLAQLVEELENVLQPA